MSLGIPLRMLRRKLNSMSRDHLTEMNAIYFKISPSVLVSHSCCKGMSSIHKVFQGECPGRLKIQQLIIRLMKNGKK